MVRRAILDPHDALAAEDQALPPGQFPVDRLPQPVRRRRGAGGRWLVWVGRAIAWAVLLLIGYRGVLAIVTDHPANGPSATAGVSTSRSPAFPASLAEAYALQFGAVFLNFSPSTAAVRAQELSRFLPPGAEPNLGWNGAGTQHLQAEQVASIAIKSTHAAIVTLLANIGGGRLIELGVPVYAGDGGMSISGRPALLPAPARAVPPEASNANPDQSTETALRNQLPAFFAAYGSDDSATLARFTAPESHIRSLGGAVTFGGIDAVFAPAGGSKRTITVTVTWKLASEPGARGSLASAPASLQMAYQLTVLRQGASWDVQSIGALAATQGPP